MAYRAAGLQVNRGDRQATLEEWQVIFLMQATIKSRNAYSSDTRRGPPFLTPGPSPVSLHVIKAYYNVVLSSITLRKAAWVRIISHTLSRLVCSIAAAIPCEDRPWGDDLLVSRYWWCCPPCSSPNLNPS